MIIRIPVTVLFNVEHVLEAKLEPLVGQSNPVLFLDQALQTF